MAEVTSKTIEELQSENAELTHIFELQRRRERPWIEKWQTETGKHNCLPDYGAMLEWLYDRAERPIDILLFCPRCAEQHIDEPQPMKGWDNPPHRSHECQTCGYVWRPADVPTNGVQEIQTKGKLDQDPMPRRSLAEIEARKKRGGG